MRGGKRVRIVSGAVTFVSGAWFTINQLINAATLPKDAADIWKAIVSAPDYWPLGLFGLGLMVLVWSLWPTLSQAFGFSTEQDRSKMEPIEFGEDERFGPRVDHSYPPRLLLEVQHDPIGDFVRRWVNQPPPPPKFDMTLNQLVRRVAFESYWAADFNPDSPSTQWQQAFWWKPLKKEIFRGLVGGDLPARGILNRKNEEPDVGPTSIPIEFWRRADFYAELMLTESSINDAVNGDRGEIYTDIEVRSSDVDGLWRARTGKSMEEKPSPFVAWHKEWWDHQEDIRLHHRMRMEEQ